MTNAPEAISFEGSIPRWTMSDRLRKARETAGLGQIELSAKAGISRATISAAENGARTPSRSVVSMWALATGVSLAWLRNGEEPPPAGDGSSVVHPPGLEPGTNWHATRFAQVTSIDDARSVREPVAEGGVAA